MATPVGHSLAGLAIYELAWGERERNWQGRVMAAILANLPDSDFIPGFLLGDINGIHHQATHSIGYVLFLGVAAYMLSRLGKIGDSLWVAFVVVVLVGSHLAIDWVTEDTSAPIGIPVFWPFSDVHYQCSVVLFTDVWRENFLSARTLLHNLRGMCIETAVLGPPWLIFWWLGSRRRKRRGCREVAR